MLKQSLIYLLLSILVVVFAKYLHHLMTFINYLYHYVDNLISPIFSKGGIGQTVCNVILLVSIPALLAAIPALLYRLIKGSTMPHFIATTWCLWLIIVLSNLLIH
jgi:hypothetical protein